MVGRDRQDSGETGGELLARAGWIEPGRDLARPARANRDDADTCLGGAGKGGPRPTDEKVRVGVGPHHLALPGIEAVHHPAGDRQRAQLGEMRLEVGRGTRGHQVVGHGELEVAVAGRGQLGRKFGVEGADRKVGEGLPRGDGAGKPRQDRGGTGEPEEIGTAHTVATGEPPDGSAQDRPIIVPRVTPSWFSTLSSCQSSLPLRRPASRSR